MTARVKQVMNMFKELAKDRLKGKTVFAVSHGYFLNNLAILLTGGNGQGDKGLLESGSFIPNNNALTVIDFDV